MSRRAEVSEETGPIKTRPSVGRIIVGHGAAFVLLIVLLWVGYNVSASLHGDRDSLWMNVILFELSRWISRHMAAGIALAGVLVFSDTQVYIWLHKCYGSEEANIWFWCGLLVLTVPILSALWMMRETFCCLIYTGCF